MPVIVFASSKGGAGKTTACIVLGCELARQCAALGKEVSLIDADPNQHTAGWAAKEGCPANLHIVADANEQTIVDAIEEAETHSAFVLVDLEGVASAAVVHAAGHADLVLVMTQASYDDAREAMKTVQLVRQTGRTVRRTIAHAVMFTRLSGAIVTREHRALEEEFRENGVPLLPVGLLDREAYRAIKSWGGPIYDLEALSAQHRSRLDKAADNAVAFAETVVSLLKEGREA